MECVEVPSGLTSPMPKDFDDEEEDNTAVHDAGTVATMLNKSTRRQTPYLIVVSGSDGVGRMVKIEGTCVIGRASDADICVTDDGVSRRHAEIRFSSDGTVQLADLGSRNGTFRNGERLSGNAFLQDGDKIQVGGTAILKFSYQDAIDEELQRNLYESATRDGLTRLYNKKYLTDALRKEYSYASRHGVALSLVLLDVDHFKVVNDKHGHPAGDFVLARLATIFTELIRVEDILARYGGEEFALVLREVSLDDALACASRLRGAVERAVFEHEGVKIPITISLGVATFVAGAYPTLDRFISAADEALYAAKRNGRNRAERAPHASG
jgi:diguanylate cyclase (GGDEF)-like protein